MSISTSRKPSSAILTYPIMGHGNFGGQSNDPSYFRNSLVDVSAIITMTYPVFNSAMADQNIPLWDMAILAVKLMIQHTSIMYLLMVNNLYRLL